MAQGHDFKNHNNVHLKVLENNKNVNIYLEIYLKKRNLNDKASLEFPQETVACARSASKASGSGSGLAVVCTARPAGLSLMASTLYGSLSGSFP